MSGLMAGPTAHRNTPVMDTTRRPAVLLATLLGMGLIAAGCGVLLLTHGLGMPLSVLAATPFSSFLIPGLLLSVVVGSSLLAAAWLVATRHSAAFLAALAAGGILLGWIVVEAALVSHGRPLQLFVALWALAILALAGREWRRHGGQT